MGRRGRIIQIDATKHCVLALLLSVLVAVPMAADPTDPPYESGEDLEAAYRLAAEAGLFGRFEATDDAYEGRFVRFRTDPQTGGPQDIHYKDTRLIERLDVGLQGGAVALQGPTATITNQTAGFTLHDNRHAWISYRGPAKEVTLRFPSDVRPESVSDGLSATIGNHTLRLFYEQDLSHNVSMDGAQVTIRPQEGAISFTITLRSGIYGHDPLPGGWLLIAHTPSGTVVDHVDRDPHEPRLEAVQERSLTLALPPIDPALRRDRVHRVESVGVYPATGVLGISVTDGLNATSEATNETTVLNGERARALHNLSRTGVVTQVVLRQASGTEGPVFLRYDADPPRILAVRFENTTRDWAPLERPPAFYALSDERVVGRLEMTSDHGQYEFSNLTKMTAVRFPLDDLLPDTHYMWRLLLTDLAGNTNATSGTFRTPVDPLQLIPRVAILGPRDGATLAPGEPVVVRATVTDGAGRPLPEDQVDVLHNGRPVTDPTWNGTRLVADLGVPEDGPHEIEIIATGDNPEHQTVRTVTFTVGGGRTVPGPGFAVAAALFGLIGFRLRGRGQERT